MTLDQKKRKPVVATTTITYLHWVDAVADVEWQNEVKAEVHDCYTVGFIVDENADAICIASTVSDKDSNARMHIPKAWVKERKEVKFETKFSKGKGAVVPAARKRSNTSKVPS
jgi:hypothetical protein